MGSHRSHAKEVRKLIMARKDRQAIDRATIAAAGFPGAIAGLVAMALDPVIAIIVVAAWLLCADLTHSPDFCNV
jgi:hypothetical protein